VSEAVKRVNVTENISLGKGEPLLIIAGPCVVESWDILRQAAEALVRLKDRLPVTVLFKSSFDKANRSSLTSFRGPGISKGLELLSRVKEEFGLPLLSDVHEVLQVKKASSLLDVLQIPAFLCRQTDLLLAAGQTGKTVNVKKGQFMSPEEMKNSVEKVISTGNKKVFVTERGTTFGYHNLVVDMRSIPIMKEFAPVVFDATHSVQLPGGRGDSSGGERKFAPSLARGAVAAGADGVFIEVHPDPGKARCDGPNSISLDSVEEFISPLVEMRTLVGGG